MAWYNPASWNDESKSTVEQRENLNNQGGMSSVFADQGQQSYNALGLEGASLRDALRRRAAGQDSLSAEQLRQGLQQNLAAQRSMAASASPGNAAMAARTAAMNAGRMGMGMSGQAAMAGIAERSAAEKQLADAIMGARQQDMGVALGSRQNAIGAYGGVTPEGTALEKAQPLINAGVGAASAYMGRPRK